MLIKLVSAFNHTILLLAKDSGSTNNSLSFHTINIIIIKYHISSIKFNKLVKNDLFPIMLLKQPLSKYQQCDSLALSIVCNIRYFDHSF